MQGQVKIRTITDHETVTRNVKFKGRHLISQLESRNKKSDDIPFRRDVIAQHRLPPQFRNRKRGIKKEEDYST